MTLTQAAPIVARADSERVLAAFERALASPRLSGSTYVKNWVGRVRCHGLSEAGRVKLAVQDKFYRDFIDDYFRGDLIVALEAELGGPVDIEWVVDESLKALAPEVAPLPPPTTSSPRPAPAAGRPASDSPAAATASTAASPASGQKPLERCRLDEKFVFETFVTAPSNQLAWAGARAVADNPGKAFNPLFIYGGTGLGKTHLLQAIGNALLKPDPNRRVVYLSSEEFTNEFIVSVRDHRMPEFRHKFRDECEGLLIDDIQFLGTKEATQDEFFFTFNALQMSGKPVVISSDTVPSEIPGLAERLRSRFSAGLIADIQEPDFETRVAILNKKAELLGVHLPDAVAHYIARIVQKNVRELQMALNRVYAHHSLAGQPLTEELAAHILKNVLPPTRPLDIEQIQKEVARYYKLSEADLKSPRRQKQFVRARQVAMYLSRNLTRASFPEIGEKFHRDHSTVMSSCEKVEADLETDLQLKKEVDDLTGRLSR